MTCRVQCRYGMLGLRPDAPLAAARRQSGCSNTFILAGWSCFSQQPPSVNILLEHILVFQMRGDRGKVPSWNGFQSTLRFRGNRGIERAFWKGYFHIISVVAQLLQRFKWRLTGQTWWASRQILRKSIVNSQYWQKTPMIINLIWRIGDFFVGWIRTKLPSLKPPLFCVLLFSGERKHRCRVQCWNRRH